MFYRYRKSDPSQQWAILSISPSVLWELDCLFCPTNAASYSVSSANDSMLSGRQALEKMFANQTDKQRVCYPHDSQAEVLVINHIPSKYIRAIYVEEKTDFLSDLELDVMINKFYFQNRNFALNYNKYDY